MTQDVRDWLPIEAAARPAVRKALDAAVGAWSTRWFARRRLLATAFTPAREEPRGEDGGWRVHGRVVAASLSRRAAARLLDWALDAAIDEPSLTRADRQLIDAFEQRLLADLSDEVEAVLKAAGRPQSAPRPTQAPLGPLGGLVIDVGGEDGAGLLRLAVPLAAVVPLSKAALPPAAPPRPPLGPVRDALNAVSVTLDAGLGAASLRLADLRALAPGDVLVLDASLSAAADVTLRRSGQALAHAKLTDIEGRMALTLQS